MRRADLAILAGLFAVLLAWPLHAPPVWTRGEAREGLVVRDIVAHGHWVIATRDGTLASKPPGFHWIAAGVARVLGLRDAVVRLPSALAAWATAAAVLLLGAELGGRRRGWLAVGILCATPFFWQSAVEARVDMVFAAALTVGLACFLVWYLRGSAGARAACHAAVVAAVLTKGPAGLVLVAATIAAFLAWQRDFAALRRFWSWPLAGATVAVIGGWYLAAYREAGAGFLEVQVINENVHRAIGLGTFHRSVSRALAMPRAMALRLLPWNLAVAVVLWRWWRGAPTDAATRFLLAWTAAIPVVFALAARVRGVYVLPVAPAVALLAAGVVEPWMTRRRVAALAALALAWLVGTHQSRLRAQRRDPLPPFAERIRPLVAGEGELRAVTALPENDALVLRWLLDRSIVRTRTLDCERGVLLLVPARMIGRARDAGLRVREAAGGDAHGLALLDCP